MKKNNLVLGYSLLAICGFFLFMTLQLPSEARLYPMFVIILLASLSILHLILTYKKDSKEKSIVFENTMFPQLFFVLIISGIYVGIMKFLGYIVTTFLYMLIILLGLKIKKSESILISLFFTIIVYMLFQKVLKVPLPKGLFI